MSLIDRYIIKTDTYKRQQEESAKLQTVLAEVKKQNEVLTNTISLQDPVLARIFADKLGAQDYGYLTKPAIQIPIIQAAIKAKAQAISSAPFELYDAKTDKLIEKGPIEDLFDDPSPNMTQQQLFEGIPTSLDMRGNAWLMKDAQLDVNKVPLALWLLNPNNVEPAYNNTHIWTGWWLTVPNQDRMFIPKEQMIHYKYYNIYDPVLGLSPMDSLRMVYETEWSAMRFNRKFFDNDASPSVVYSTDKNLNEPQRERFKEDLIERKKGVEQSHQTILLEGGMKAASFQFSQRDMEFLEQRKYNTQDVLMVLGVQKTQLSIYEDVNYATALIQDKSFYNKTIIPLLGHIAQKTTSDFLADYGMYGKFDLKKVDAVNDLILDKVKAAVDLVGIGFTANEVNERFAMGFAPQPWRDEPLISTRTIVDPAEAGKKPPAAPGETPSTQDKPEPDDPQQTSLNETDTTAFKDDIHTAIRTNKWKSLEAPIIPIMSRAAQDLRTYYHDIELKVYNKLTTGYEKGGLKTGQDNILLFANEDKLDIGSLFQDEKLIKVMDKHVEDGVMRGHDSIIKSHFGPNDQIAKGITGKRLTTLIQVNETARTWVETKIVDILKEAATEGWSEQQTADALIEGVKEKFAEIKTHAKTVARTEIHGAYSEGRNAGMIETGADRIEWVSSRDDRVRDSHAELDGTIIPIGEEFSKGLKYPLDPDCPDPEEVINCRCNAFPYYEGEK